MPSFAAKALWVRPDRHRIRRTALGWQAYFTIRLPGETTKRFVSQHFPPKTTVTAMQQWRENRRAELRSGAKRLSVAAGTFEDDAARYLQAVRAMPSYRDRAKHIGMWVALFGQRPRSSISAREIRAQRDRWLIEPRRVTRSRKRFRVVETKPPYAASSVNQFLRALSNLWRVLDGPRAPNPVRDVPEADEPDPTARGTTFAAVEAVLAGVKPSASRARVRVLLYTGLSPSTLKRVHLQQVRWDRAELDRPRRRKGRGTRSEVVPLHPAALAAFRSVAEYDAWGEFSTAALCHSLQRWCRSADAPLLTLRDLRHTFGSEMYRRSGDALAVQRLLAARGENALS